jgi:ABC-type maltose transport system permease subunit
MAYFGVEQITALLNTVLPLMVTMMVMVMLMKWLGSAMERVTAAIA